MLVRKGLRKGKIYERRLPDLCLPAAQRVYQQSAKDKYTLARKSAVGSGREERALLDRSLDRYFVIVAPRKRRPARSMAKVYAAYAAAYELESQ
jgi:hypothetical protein